MENTKDLVLAAGREYQEKFKNVIGGFEDRGILNSEMLIVCALSQFLGVEVIIESGRWRGQSTEVLGRYFADTPVLIESIELYRDENARYVENKLAGRKNVHLNYGNANTAIPRLLRKHADKKIALLFDGPKGQEAVDVFRLALAVAPSVAAGFFHDMRRSASQMPNRSREELLNSFPRSFFSDDPDFLRAFSFLDANSQDTWWKPNFIHGKPIGSYGPTLGVVLPAAADFRAARNDRWRLRFLSWRRELFTLCIHVYHFVRGIFTGKRHA